MSVIESKAGLIRNAANTHVDNGVSEFGGLTVAVIVDIILALIKLWQMLGFSNPKEKMGWFINVATNRVLEKSLPKELVKYKKQARSTIMNVLEASTDEEVKQMYLEAK